VRIQEKLKKMKLKNKMILDLKKEEILKRRKKMKMMIHILIQSLSVPTRNHVQKPIKAN
jgi:hypothetical protein